MSDMQDILDEKSFDRLIRSINELQSILEKIGISFHGKEILPAPWYILSLLERFKNNGEAFCILLQTFKENRNVKTALGIISRTLSGDVLTMLYLFCFTKKSNSQEEIDYESAQNEIYVIYVDSLRKLRGGMENMVRINSKFTSPIPFLPTKEEFEETKKRLELQFSFFYEGNDLKNNDSLRNSSDASYFPNGKKGSLTEKSKYNLIVEKHPKFALVFAHFSYFSQYVHPSVTTKSFNDAEDIRDMAGYFQIWDFIALATFYAIDYLQLNDEEMKQSIKDIKTKFDPLLSN